jgi:hypothetical protein
MTRMAVEHFDVLIMGAGLSGIDAAHHLQKPCPNKSYIILEQRELTGGTWDLFRYPGVLADRRRLHWRQAPRIRLHPLSPHVAGACQLSAYHSILMFLQAESFGPISFFSSHPASSA